MRKPSDYSDNRNNLRNKIIGLGDCSIKKSYYTQLQEQVENLERSREDLIDAIKRAEASENILRAVFDNATDGIVLADIETKKFSMMNRAMLSILGYDEGTDPDLSFFDIHPEEKIPYAMSQFVRLAEGKINLAREIPVKRKDGTIIYVDISGAPIVINERRYIAAIFRDMTEHRKAAIEKSDFESRLHQMQKMEAIGTLAGGVAHDFNNILMAIMGFAELSMKHVKKGEPLHRNIGHILESCYRARDLVSELLSMSYKGEKKLEPLNLIPVIEDTIKLIRATLPSTVSIGFMNNAEFDTVLSDRTQISQIILNLCTNAAHAMPAMDGEIKINVANINVDAEYASSHPDLNKGAYFLLQVIDDGSGIDPSILGRIFEPFFTTKERGKGTGLGLSVIHGIVKGHRGAIYVDSIPGEGTTFEIYLPVSGAEINEVETVKEINTAGGETILLVDDEEVLTEVNADILESMGYKVIRCNSGADALTVFSEDPERIDLVVTDMTMPGMTGLNLSIELKRIKTELPVILCTGYNEQLTKEKAEEAGVLKIIMKPFSSAELGIAVKNGLNMKQGISH